MRFLFELNNSSPNNTINDIQSHYNSHFEDAILKMSHYLSNSRVFLHFYIYNTMSCQINP